MNNAPVRDPVEIYREPQADPKNLVFASRWPRSWVAWFNQVASSLTGWKKTYTAVKTHNFGSINSLAEDSTTVTVTGARVGDAVVVSPSARTVGIIDNYGTVTADDTATLYAMNFTAGPINPGSKDYRIIVFQQ